MPLAPFSEYEENIAEVSHLDSANFLARAGRKVSFAEEVGMPTKSLDLKSISSNRLPPIPSKSKSHSGHFNLGGIMKKSETIKPNLPLPPPRKKTAGVKKALSINKSNKNNSPMMPEIERTRKGEVVKRLKSAPPTSYDQLRRAIRPISYNSSISSPVILRSCQSNDPQEPFSSSQMVTSPANATVSSPVAQSSVPSSTSGLDQKTKDQNQENIRNFKYASSTGLGQISDSLQEANLFERYHHGSFDSNMSGTSSRSNPFYAEDIEKFAPLALSALISSSDFVKKTERLSRAFSASSLEIDNTCQSNSSLFVGSYSATTAQDPIKKHSHSSSAPNLTKVAPVIQCHKCHSSLTQLVEVEIPSPDYTSYSTSSSSSDSSDYSDFSDVDADESESDFPKEEKRIKGNLKGDLSSSNVSSIGPPNGKSAVSICNVESVVIGICESSEDSSEASIPVTDSPYHIKKASIIKSRERLNPGVFDNARNRPAVFKCCKLFKCCQCFTQMTLVPFLWLFIFFIIIGFVILIDLLPAGQESS